MARLHETKIDIPAEDRKALIDLLNVRLADTVDLHSQVKQAHWNVKGTDFFQLHELFDNIASQAIEHVDDLAERATTLGGTALGTARMAAATSVLPEYPTEITAGQDHLAALIDRYGTYTALIRAASKEAASLGDDDTADLFTEVSRSAAKSLWFLEAHVQA